MCRLTEQVIFTDPYHAAPVNSHTTPHLDELVHSLRSDTQAKLAASSLKVLINMHHTYSVTRVSAYVFELCVTRTRE